MDNIIIYIITIVISLIFFYLYKSKIKEIEQKNEELKKITTQKQEIEIKNSKLEVEINILKEHQFKQEMLFNDQQKKQEEWIKQQQETQKQIFQNISNNTLERQNEIGKKQINEILNPFKEDIEKCKQAIDKVNGETKTEINTKISEMLKYTQEVGKSADNLAEAFRGDKKQQGNFGEMKFRNLLNFYGFQENQDYYEQYLVKTEEQKKKYPDFILQTQQNRWLVIDSKFSILNYQKYIESKDENEKQQYLKSYVKDLKDRINELGKKEYNKLLKQNGKETFDFVCLFFGNEMAYLTAISDEKYRNDIFESSAKNKVAILTSSSFAPILQIIRRIWEMENFNKNIYNARETIDKWLKKISSFQNNLDKIGRYIDSAKNTYNEAYKQLVGDNGSATKLAQKVLETITEKDINEDKQEHIKNLLLDTNE